MKQLSYLLIIVLFASCGAEVQIDKLNGYWEIDHVMFANATKKKYAMNLTVDYFEYKDSIGFVKKVQPQLDGSFKASNDRQYFRIDTTETGIYLNFDNGIREKISRLNSSQLILQTVDSTSFHYKAYQPLQINSNE